jgi:hypothetical protein
MHTSYRYCIFWGVRFTPSIKLTTMTGLSIEFKVSAENLKVGGERIWTAVGGVQREILVISFNIVVIFYKAKVKTTCNNLFYLHQNIFLQDTIFMKLYPQDRKYCINTIQMNIYMFDCIILSQCI